MIAWLQRLFGSIDYVDPAQRAAILELQPNEIRRRRGLPPFPPGIQAAPDNDVEIKAAARVIRDEFSLFLADLSFEESRVITSGADRSRKALVHERIDAIVWIRDRLATSSYGPCLDAIAKRALDAAAQATRGSAGASQVSHGVGGSVGLTGATVTISRPGAGGSIKP